VTADQRPLTGCPSQRRRTSLHQFHAIGHQQPVVGIPQGRRLLRPAADLVRDPTGDCELWTCAKRAALKATGCAFVGVVDKRSHGTNRQRERVSDYVTEPGLGLAATANGRVHDIHTRSTVIRRSSGRLTKLTTRRPFGSGSDEVWAELFRRSLMARM